MVQIINVIIIAVGLSMDAFSLSILYGTLKFDVKKTLTLSISVGVFHFFMPLLGNAIGIMLLKLLPFKPDAVVGIVFMILSIQMFISIFKDEEIIDVKGILSIILFAFTVSIDSFSVGIGLSALCSSKVLASIIFALVSFLFTFTGLIFGNKLSEHFGSVTTFIGSIILFVMSFVYLF